MMRLHYRTWVEISLDRIAANYHSIRAEAGAHILVAPVVKADAYRHGSVPVALRLAKEGASWMAVSNAEEGVVLRVGGVRTRILLMGDFLELEREELVSNNLTPVVHSLARLRDLDRFAAAADSPIAYHLKIDSGMGRLGSRATPADLIEAVRSATHARLEGLMTHLASASDYESKQTDEQLMLFESVRRAFAQAGLHPPLVHAASTGTLAHGRREAYGSMVRPGLAIYGYVPSARGSAPAVRLKLKPALEWKARVLEVKQIPQGAPVGYGAQWRAARPTTAAVVAAGYADGIPHALSNRGRVIAAGRLAPIIGAVSMDLTSIDVTDFPPLRTGDAVTLLGSEGGVNYDAQDIAEDAGTISHAVLCGLGNRVKRVYV
jgi:alanine racemase